MSIREEFELYAKLTGEDCGERTIAEMGSFLSGYRKGKEDAEPNWIPVTERMPEDDTVVLVCGKSGGVYTAIHNNSKTWIRGWWKMNSKNHHCNPIAWMPLPEPYKGVTT